MAVGSLLNLIMLGFLVLMFLTVCVVPHLSAVCAHVFHFLATVSVVYELRSLLTETQDREEQRKL